MNSIKTSAVRRIQFCSGHRVFKHESKCATPHGHNYVAYFHAEAEHLDQVGRVIDFSVLKERLGDWIDKNWDHKFLVYQEDLELIWALDSNHLSILDTNPTAENMAGYLLTEVAPKVLSGTGVIITKVVLYETENCFVEVEL